MGKVIHGRVISEQEHNIPGIVYVGRPVRENVVLSPELQARLEQQLVKVQALKEAASIATASIIEQPTLFANE